MTCPLHGAVVIVAAMGEWAVKCEDCKYARRFGRDQLAADVKAAKHALTRMHTITVYRRGALSGRRVEPRRQQPTLSDEPPF